MVFREHLPSWGNLLDTAVAYSSGEMTPAAGGLLLTGDLEDNFLAFDAATGKMISKKQTGGPMGGGIITYLIDGKQYVAVAAGMTNALMGTKSGPSSVLIYSLPDNGSKP